MSLDPIAKEVWCEALRSGEFPQTQNKLKSADGWCCLGVAAEIFPALKQADREEELLSVNSLALLNITWEQQHALAYMNDRPMPFAEIADYIEREL